MRLSNIHKIPNYFGLPFFFAQKNLNIQEIPKKALICRKILFSLFYMYAFSISEEKALASQKASP